MYSTMCQVRVQASFRAMNLFSGMLAFSPTQSSLKVFSNQPRRQKQNNVSCVPDYYSFFQLTAHRVFSENFCSIITVSQTMSGADAASNMEANNGILIPRISFDTFLVTPGISPVSAFRESNGLTIRIDSNLSGHVNQNDLTDAAATCI